MKTTTRPPHCHGNCVNAPVGDPPYQQTFNMLCEGCRTHSEDKQWAEACVNMWKEGDERLLRQRTTA